MSEKLKMSLHLGKCIDDLDKLHNIPDLKGKRATILCKSAQKLFEKAEESNLKGDEENAYVYYMKYLRIIAFLTKEKEYLNAKTYFNSMLGSKNPNKAIDAAEKLKESLKERYELEVGQTLNTDKNTEEEVKKPAPPSPSQAPSNLPGLDEVVITSEQLYPILKSGKASVMILDARSAQDYMESHINHPTCISVPQEVISPGQSANVLEQNLPLTSRAVWARRAGMDLIVMLDWSSATFIPGKTLFLLKTILLKWDVKVHYARPPLALTGGYEDWLLKYPSFTTNPRAKPPQRSDPLEPLLDDIEYPTWSELSPPAEPASSSAPRPAKPGEPVVDRTSKAAAVQMYEERSRNMKLILEQQERLVDTSLTLEMQRIEAEQNWEEVRGQRDGEQREEMRDMYKLREQEIISQLMQLENKQYDMEQENQALREQLEEYQRRERDDAEKLAESIAKDGEEEDKQRIIREQAQAARELAAKRARIAAVTEQRDQLDRQRERLELERKRKLADARNKKKPDLDKDEDGDTYMKSPDSPRESFEDKPERPESLDAAPGSDEEGLLAMPTFDRSTKPAKQNLAVVKQRNFGTKFAETERGRGLTGLSNLGNSCYMNTIIQCLSNTTILTQYFCDRQYLKHINRSHSTRGAVAIEMAAVIEALWSGRYQSITAVDLKNELGKHQRLFSDGRQQDSHEFLTILMDYLHLDLQFDLKYPKKENMLASEKAWHEFTKSKESLILRLFYGQIKSTVTCTVCGKQSVTYDSFSNLSLELPTGPNVHRCTLGDCLQLYLNGEMIPGWNCPNCRQKRNAIKKLDISRLPPILVIHFKRFSGDPATGLFQKILTYVDFPLTGLDMRQFTSHCENAYLYNLYGVSNHYGNTLLGGHYTATCWNSVYGKWYKYDDHLIHDCPESDVKSSAAYICFYASCRV